MDGIKLFHFNNRNVLSAFLGLMRLCDGYVIPRSDKGYQAQIYGL